MQLYVIKLMFWSMSLYGRLLIWYVWETQAIVFIRKSMYVYYSVWEAVCLRISHAFAKPVLVWKRTLFYLTISFLNS